MRVWSDSIALVRGSDLSPVKSWLVRPWLSLISSGEKNEIRVIKLEAYAKFIPNINRAYFKHFSCQLGMRIGGKVIIKLTAEQAVKTEILYAVTFELELDRKVHVYGLIAKERAAVFRDIIFK